MSRGLWITLGATLGVGGAVFLGSRRASASTPPNKAPTTPPADAPAPAIELAPLPTAVDVHGDLVTNWGDTPADLRPLFMLMEETSKIAGSARLFAGIAYRESQFISSAQNGNADNEQAERDSSRAAYKNNKDRNPPLRHGEQAAEFGSGGLFGLLAPYFLWTGVPEVGKRAPLLNAPPEVCFEPRAAAFGAAVYLQRLLQHYRIDDLADIKVGWANPSLLGSGRGNNTYHDVRARFLGDMMTLGIDITHATFPAKLSATAWPGVPAVFAALVGALPKEMTT